MNYQAVFSQVLDHIRYQGRPSTLRDGTCQYRGDEPGTACAIGILIPSSSYQPEMEGLTVSDLNEQNRSLLANALNDGKYLTTWDTEFLEKLQAAHDMPSQFPPDAFLTRFERYMRQIASLYDLHCSEAVSLTPIKVGVEAREEEKV